MDLNATLIIQSITFLVFVFLMWRYAWPHILGAMQARQAHIAEGLAAAERGSRALQDASVKSEEALKAARSQAQEIISSATKQASQVVEQAKGQAQTEADRIKEAAHAEAQREIAAAREALRKQVGELAVLGASRIIKREINPQTHGDVLKELAAKI